MYGRRAFFVFACLMWELLVLVSAQAGEKTLEFQLVTKLLDPRVLVAPDAPEHTITQARAVGVAIFKDGRVGVKDFIGVCDYTRDGAGPLFGYGTYSFDDGSSLTVRFGGEAKPGQVLHGEYKILSGTGAYAGATGSGSFDRIAAKLEGVSLYNVKLNVTTP